VELPGC